MLEPKQVVDILRHARHDWLNQLQLIKGNLELGKTDRAKQIIDEIIIEARHESRLCSMGLDQFSSLLLTYNWIQPLFALEYEVLELNGKAPISDETITEWTSDLFTYIGKSLDPEIENHLSISIEVGEKIFRLLFDFRGKLLPGETLDHFINENPLENSSVIIIDETEQELSFQLTF